METNKRNGRATSTIGAAIGNVGREETLREMRLVLHHHRKHLLRVESQPFALNGGQQSATKTVVRPAVHEWLDDQERSPPFRLRWDTEAKAG